MENGTPVPNGDDSDVGGSANSGAGPGGGGATGTGGAAPTGGAIGTGGNVSTGGTTGAGGTQSTGGIAGNVATGGAVGTGGTATGGNATGGAVTGGTATGGAMGGGGASGGTTGGAAGRGGAATGGTAGGGRGGSGGSGGKAGTGGGGSGGKAGSGGSGGGGMTCMSTPVSGGTQRCSSNAQGNLSGGYAWQIWSSGSGGCMTPYGVGAAFKANWNNSGDFLARVGLNFGSNRTWQQLGTVVADYVQTKSGNAGGYSYIGIYGWSVNPLHEYYIIDDWYGTRPSFAGDKVGEVTLDGAIYDILTETRVNQPAITGRNETFVQFWSLRQTARQCGRISITEHFRAWQNIGLTLGNMVEAKLLVEAGGGVGNIDFTRATITAQ